MRGLNKAMLIGRLGKDPEVQYFESGAVKASFPLATSESWKDKEGNKVERTDWHNIVMWRGLASVAEKYLKKGSLVYIEGKIKTRSWDDQSGNKRYITEIDASDMQMLDTRNTAGAPKPEGYGSPEIQQQKPANVVNDIPEEDDLPF